MYAGYVKFLKFIQLLGYCLGVIIAGLMSWVSLQESGNLIGAVFLFVFVSALFCVVIYASTQAAIAVIDLLNKIEAHTRTTAQSLNKSYGKAS